MKGAEQGERGRIAGIEERNQRRLSAYEVGIVGWRRTVHFKNSSPWALVVCSRCKRTHLEMADVLFFFSFRNRPKLVDK